LTFRVFDITGDTIIFNAQKLFDCNISTIIIPDDPIKDYFTIIQPKNYNDFYLHLNNVSIYESIEIKTTLSSNHTIFVFLKNKNYNLENNYRIVKYKIKSKTRKKIMLEINSMEIELHKK
jgi:hypothetical protein